MLKRKSGTNALTNYYEHPGLSGGIHSVRR
ncbi:hypothetical protein MYCO108962_10965 [Mycobacterium colombiense]|uniref:Uncharacterized protein n=1 Tax=Mycobacterium [tuberculosis] TKK-01-0051 TaxID=1324261 RepID=A0A051U7E1_9MYCO|nr:hypothetical protein K875_01887 [Mycobacterium [tuberculosis] TKK-01-0051]